MSILKRIIISAILVSQLCMIFFLQCVTVYGRSDYIDVGDYVALGRYNKQTIIWRCIDIDENGPLMMSDDILCIKAFDSPGREPSGSHGVQEMKNPSLKWAMRDVLSPSYRHRSGSNYWKDSNIRCWLNSEAPEKQVIWSCGNPPGAYSTEAGFLSDKNFTYEEKLIIKTVTQKNLLDPLDAFKAQGGEVVAWDEWPKFTYEYKDSSNKALLPEKRALYDAISYEYTEDRMFLPDVLQYIKLLENRDILGEYTIASIDGRWLKYWLRTPYGLEREDVTFGDGTGDRLITAPFCTKDVAYSNMGVRPAFYLEDNAIILSGDGTKEHPYSFSPHVNINGDALSFDVSPQIEDERVLVPMRAIFEALGATVEWDESDNIITAEKDGHEIKLQIGMNEMYIDKKMIWLDVSPRIKSDRTLVPIRAVSEAFGATVEWEEAISTVKITI